MQMQPPPPPRLPAPAAVNAVTHTARPSSRSYARGSASGNVFVQLARIPFGIIRATLRAAFQTVGFGWNVIAFIGNRFLPFRLLRVSP